MKAPKKWANNKPTKLLFTRLSPEGILVDNILIARRLQLIHTLSDEEV